MEECWTNWQVYMDMLLPFGTPLISFINLTSWSSKEGSWADWWGWIALFQKIADILSFSFFMLHVKTDFVSACLFVMFSLSCLKKDARMKQTGV